MKHNFRKYVGYGKSSSKRKVHSYTGIPQEAEKIPNKQSNLTPKGTRKITNKTQSRKKRHNKDQS